MVFKHRNIEALLSVRTRLQMLYQLSNGAWADEEMKWKRVSSSEMRKMRHENLNSRLREKRERFLPLSQLLSLRALWYPCSFILSLFQAYHIKLSLYLSPRQALFQSHTHTHTHTHALCLSLIHTRKLAHISLSLILREEILGWYFWSSVELCCSPVEGRSRPSRFPGKQKMWNWKISFC